ncbi:glycosyltransferase family 4 protein [Nostoc spongiaeforme FACHB-130]|uniref:Glycosyltransferase family 4 protein n=1 Tax=Nostoc spongiaeforme FACHB-130 TaxID=1357510 RepID=A0ABR8FXF1_9NOSO|nr:glycosyltransferase family 4 protein [Nostoc spongiaeforme]MBD2594942.1 glycosyltransferase family 4 protein [Nostoc spongiaeforme FACHB-130]
MKIGYLHIGSEQHGIHRYSKFIASEARQRGFTVIEANVVLTESLHHNREILVEAANKLSSADIVHVQHNTFLWGERSQLKNFRVFVQNCSSPLVVTLHDIYLPKIPLHWKTLLSYIKSQYNSNSRFIRWMFAKVQKVLVCTEQERQRLHTVVGINTLNASKITLIRHFVEERLITANSAIARKKLNLEGFQTITLLGWIFPRKGHRLVVEAIPYLSTNIKVIFAGQPSERCDWFLEELLTLAQTLGVKDRLIVTGYLSEEELEQYLVATDLAICPFQKSSASGSLSTWLSIAHPKILSFDLPLIDEYNNIEPGAIKTFSPYTANAFAQAVQHILSNSDEQENLAVKNLRQHLCMSTILVQHLDIYSQITEKKQKSEL